MDPNNSGFIVEDALNESDFTSVSSMGGMELKQIVDRIQKLEDMVKKNAMGTSNGDQSGVIQMGLQIGEKFGELKKDLMAMGKENGEMKDAMEKMMKELEGVKVEKDNEIERIKKENANGIDKMLKAFEELKEENGCKLSEMAKLIVQFGGKNSELEGQITGLKEEEEKMKEKMAELERKIEEMTGQIGGVEWVKYDWKAFKLDAAKCGPKLTISEGGFVAKHSGPHRNNIVFATLPIPTFNSSAAINKSIIAFYYEVQILTNVFNGCSIAIGFCTQQFPLEEKFLGNWNNSISFWKKGKIRIDGIDTKLGNVDEYFSTGDFVGIGIIHKPNSKMECFETWNGQLLLKAALPSKFVDLPLFPAITLGYTTDSIRVNFEKENCQFKEFGPVLQ